jgi:hypothetical protein
MAYVYRHIRLDKNEPFYIGIGSDSTYRRANNKTCRNSYWKNIVNKTDYRIDILLDDLTWDEACDKEREFISLYGRLNTQTGTLCNLTDGGDGMLGYKHNAEWLVKLSEMRKSFKYSNESKLKMSESKRGKKVSDDVRKKMSERISGSNHFMYGKNHSEQTRLKISKSHIGKKCPYALGGLNPRAKIVFNLNNGVYYDCGKDAAKSLGITYYVFKHMMRRSLDKRKFPLIYV